MIMKNIKLIELLVMTTKKRKEMPAVIEYHDEIYEWNENIRDYQGKDKFLFMDLFKTNDYNLNDEITISYKYPYSFKKINML